MEKINQSVNDAFLINMIETKMPVTLFLANGVKLQGRVVMFDGVSIVLDRDGHSQLVYKHAISTIMPLRAISIFEENV